MMNTTIGPTHIQHPPRLIWRDNDKDHRRSPPRAIPILLIYVLNQIPCSFLALFRPNNHGLLIHRLLLEKALPPQPLPIGFIPLLLRILFRHGERVFADLEHLNVKRFIIVR